MKQIYIIKCDYNVDCIYEAKTLFATDNEEKAKKYVDKFNKLHKKLYDFFWGSTIYEEIRKQGLNKFERWLEIDSIAECYYEKIKFK